MPLLTQWMATLLVRLSVVTARWSKTRLVRAKGESTTTSHLGYLVVSLVLVAMALVFALGPGKTWVSSIFSSVTAIQPPTMPSGS